MTATMTRTEVVSTAPAAPLGTGAFVTSQRGVTIDALLHQHMSWIRLPGSYLNLINQIQQLTRWSFRDLGDVLGTSHTTVGKLANGALPTTRSQEAAERLEPLLEVLSRISAVTTPGRELADVLGSGTGSGDRPLDHLEHAVRDVLAQFWIESDGSTAYALVAVLPGGPFAGNEEAVVIARQWLAEAALAVDADLDPPLTFTPMGTRRWPLPTLRGRSAWTCRGSVGHRTLPGLSVPLRACR